MFCRKCGNQIPDDSEFCPKCGVAVGENQTPPAETREVDKNAFASSYEYKSSYNSTDDNKTSSYSSDREAPQSGENVITSPSVVAVKAKPKISKKALIIILSITGVLLVAGLIIFIAYVNRDQYPDFKYYLSKDGTYTIGGYKGSDPNVVIPDEMYGKPVTKIYDNAFWGLKAESVTLGNNIKEIGDCAFLYTNIESLTLGDNVETIGDGAFSYSTLKTITLSADLSPHIFEQCTQLETVYWNCDIYTMHSISQDAFAGCTSLRQIVVAGETATYPRQISEIIKKYESIGAKQITFNDQAFKDCQYFKNPAKPAEPETPVEQPKLTYSQIVEKYGMPEYYVGYNAYYDKYNLTVGFSNRTYSYNDGSKCFIKSNNSRVEYIILYGDKSTIIDSNMGNMHLGENLDYYSNYMSFDVYDALEMGAGDHGASWYELGYRHNNNGVTDYYATIEFTADDLYSYAVKVEYVGY